MERKLGVNATQRLALIKNQASELLWHGKITTTEARAKEVASYVAKIITLAVNSYTDTIETEVSVADAKGKETTKTLIKDLMELWILSVLPWRMCLMPSFMALMCSLIMRLSQ